jgi:hypothetical protein
MENDVTKMTDGGVTDFYTENENKPRRKSKEEIFAKYFRPKKETETFRIVPVNQGDKFYDTVYYHLVPTIVTGGKIRQSTAIYCPRENDPNVPKLDEQGKPILQENGQPVMVKQPCALCDKYEAKIAKQDPEVRFKKREQLTDAQLVIKEKNDKIFAEAGKIQAKKHYVMRGIDRGATGDGIKFWRVKHNFKKQGTMDKLVPVLQNYNSSSNVLFYDPNNGIDLSILMGEAEYRGFKYMEVKAIIPKQPSALSSDPIEKEKWLKDKTTWRDVFKPKTAPNITPYQYTKMVVDGQSPYYDENIKRWIFPGHPELEEEANKRKDEYSTENSYADHGDYDDDETSVSVTPSISTITEADVNKTKHVSVDVFGDFVEKPKSTTAPSEYDDLPF